MFTGVMLVCLALGGGDKEAKGGKPTYAFKLRKRPGLTARRRISSRRSWRCAS